MLLEISKEEVQAVLHCLSRTMARNTNNALDLSEKVEDRLRELINKPVETTNECPKHNCQAKYRANDEQSLPMCKCHNFCKYDNLQFDTSIG